MTRARSLDARETSLVCTLQLMLSTCLGEIRTFYGVTLLDFRMRLIMGKFSFRFETLKEVLGLQDLCNPNIAHPDLISYGILD